MAKTIVKKCECKHESQDEIYGHSFRLHNTGKKGAVVTYKCTVCGKKS